MFQDKICRWQWPESGRRQLDIIVILRIHLCFCSCLCSMYNTFQQLYSSYSCRSPGWEPPILGIPPPLKVWFFVRQKLYPVYCAAWDPCSSACFLLPHPGHSLMWSCDFCSHPYWYTSIPCYSLSIIVLPFAYFLYPPLYHSQVRNMCVKYPMSS